MLDDQHLAVKTATKRTSIWHGLPEPRFRERMVTLERASKEIPEDPKVHSLRTWQDSRPGELTERRLPLAIEQRLADDLAFVAANAESVKSVSAVAIEECFNPPSLRIRLTANGVASSEVLEALEFMLLTLSRCARRSILLIMRWWSIKLTP